MTRTADNGVAFCYAETAGTHWAAYCLTFDLAVGASLAEVRGKLAEQISLYLETVRDLPRGSGPADTASRPIA